MNVRTASVLFVVFVYAIAANVPFWLAGHSMGLLLTGVFNVELLVLGMLSVFLRRWVTVVLLAIAVALDMVRGVSLLLPARTMKLRREMPRCARGTSWYSMCIGRCLALRCARLSGQRSF
jgi:hypothetical protein